MNKYHITKKNYISRVLTTVVCSIIIPFIYVAVIASLEEEQGLNLQNTYTFVGFILSGVIPLILGLVFGWILMRRRVFYDDGNSFVVESGLINKKQRKIPYENINMIAVKRSLLDRIIGISTIEIETDTTASPHPEGKLALEKDYALALKEYLENKKNNKDLALPNPEEFDSIEIKEENVICAASGKELFLFGILRPGYLATIVVATMFITSSMQVAYYFEDNEFTFIQAILLTIAAIVVILALITFLFGLATYMTFYQYKLKLKDDFIEYEYGLFSKKYFKFKKDRINALYLRQSIGLRLFDKYSLESSIIGIGEFNQQDQNDNSNYESKYILPIANYDKTLEVLKILDAERLITDTFVGPTRLRKTNFIFLPLILPTIALPFIAIMFLIVKSTYLIIVLNLIIGYIILVDALDKRMNNHGYDITKDLIIRTGSYTIVRSLIRRNKIQNTAYTQHPFHQLMKIGNISFHYRKLLGTKKLYGYTKEEFVEIKKIV